MKKMSQRILFFGNERLATGLGTTAPVFNALVEAGYEIPALVVAQEWEQISRKTRGVEIVALAQNNDIPILSPNSLLALDRDELAVYGAEAAVLIAYGKIVPQEIIDIFPRGIINLHPSLLPKHRGSTPIERVILNGENATGVSLMSLTGKMDAGPIYAQEKLLLIGTESKRDLTHKLRDMGKDMLLEHLPAILDGSLKPKPQDDSQATYDKQIVKSDGVLDFSKPALQLEREVRAYAGWPRSRTKLGSTDVIITKAHVAEGGGDPGKLFTEDKQLGVYTGDGILIIDSLIPAGKPEMSAAAFLAGYQLN
jgi:methionyl-tRNA formyltransferase